MGPEWAHTALHWQGNIGQGGARFRGTLLHAVTSVDSVTSMVVLLRQRPDEAVLTAKDNFGRTPSEVAKPVTWELLERVIVAVADEKKRKLRLQHRSTKLQVQRSTRIAGVEPAKSG